MTNDNIPRILIAGDRSSSGKTTISVGIMALLCDMGYKVQPFKVGLDFIDPSYHTEVTGRASRNLDGYLMSEEAVKEVYSHAIKGSDIAVIEGVRGLYEGLEATSDIGSTAQIAKMLKCPVILVINARSITRSCAALVSGYKSFDTDIDIKGVILNNIGGERHLEKAKTSIETYTDTKVIGAIPRNDSMKLSMRHLGLIPALEGRRKVDDFDKRLSNIKNIVTSGIDIDKFLSIANSSPQLPYVLENIFKPTPKTTKPKIAVALDEAFNFYYRDNLELLELSGAELVYFSPVNDKNLPKSDGVYIGGGYPELFTQQLEDNISMRESIKQASIEGVPTYAECGGLMYLTSSITNDVKKDGNYEMAEMKGGTYEMVSALPGKTLMGHKRVVSYNIGSFVKDNVIGKKGDSFIGHEFHHSEIVDIPDNTDFAIKLTRGTGIKGELDGIYVKNTLGGYAHLHGASYINFAKCFVDFCEKK